MNREGTAYEIAHFLAVVGLAYLALRLAGSVGITALWAELVVAGAVGVSYVLAVFALDLAPPSWRGE
ncbi:hypothetical protein HAPAU_08300 [Halalkalicoccus paucihalophilus]|uniref:Uncharacterized protein n=1 Tax=Halalkalicoccus paucihalophilus TaxID=1008153 RepID=A0A151AHB2_9EURY|nr:hypothetical protein [Halalkalicoccus paucihalophilus]KYH26942.1 hypothetical protein HAPAU_08300 [Halalkalicoccus paucihalophilus]